MSEYPINISYSDKDGGYIADIPDLESCSAFGQTPEEALAEVEKAREAWLKEAMETGKPIPPPNYRQTTLQVSRIEEILFERMGHSMDMTIKLAQWGITVLIGLQTAIFFVRKDMLIRVEKLLGAKYDPLLLPWSFHFIGTFFLLIIASIFCFLTYRATERYRHYKKQLVNISQKSIEDIPVSRYFRKLILSFFFVFPAIDILIRIYLSLLEIWYKSEKVNIWNSIWYFWPPEF